MSEFMTLETLGTFAGVSAATGIIVQIIKDKIPFKTQYLSLLVAFILMTVVTLLTVGGTSAAPYFMNGVNAFIIAGVTSNTANFLINLK